MSTIPPSRNPKRARQKEGSQARRAAELAALKRQQRNRRIVRVAIFAFVAVGAVLLVSALGGDDDEPTATDTTTSTSALDELTTTTAVPIPATPLTCEGPSGENTDLATKPEVTVPDSPSAELTCQDLVVGDGDEVLNSNDVVQVQYVGVAQSNGTEFDASWEREPFTTSLESVVAGWTHGIPGMKVGGRRVLTIPGELAYGPEGRPPDIGPNDTLVFVVDLLAVNPQP